MARRSLKQTTKSRLIRLRSAAADDFLDSVASCPNSPSLKKTCRLVVVGAPRTGKTAIVNRFLYDKFDERYIPTIEEYYRKQYKIHGDIYQLEIMDCSGNDPFPVARRLCYLSGDLFLIVGSVDQEDSISQMIYIWEQIIECRSTRQRDTSDSVPILFALNKIDLPSAKWEIDSDEVCERLEECASKVDNIYQCSASTPSNIGKIFGKVFALGKMPKLATATTSLQKYETSESEIDYDESVTNKIMRRFKKRFSREGSLLSMDCREITEKTTEVAGHELKDGKIQNERQCLEKFEKDENRSERKISSPAKKSTETTKLIKPMNLKKFDSVSSETGNASRTRSPQAINTADKKCSLS